MTAMLIVFGFAAGFFGAMTLLDEFGVEPGLGLILTLASGAATAALMVVVFG